MFSSLIDLGLARTLFQHSVCHFVVVDICEIVLPGSISHTIHSFLFSVVVKSVVNMTLYDSLPRHSDMSLYYVHVSSDVVYSQTIHISYDAVAVSIPSCA